MVAGTEHILHFFIDERYFGIADRFAQAEVTDHKRHRVHGDCLVDMQTNEVYRFDHYSPLMSKFVAMLVALPLYASSKACFHAVALPTAVAQTLLTGCLSILGAGTPTEAPLLGPLGHHSVEVVRSGYYYVGISLSLLRGLCLSTFADPNYVHETRTIVAHLEREWSHFVPRSEDFRTFPKHRDFSKIHYYYLAFCFLPHGTLTETFGDDEVRRYEATDLARL